MILLSKKKYYNDSTYSYRENRISFVDNPEQKELNRLIRDNNTKIIFCTGNAGTGKTFCTLYTSYQLSKDHRIDLVCENILNRKDLVGNWSNANSTRYYSLPRNIRLTYTYTF